MLFVRSRFRLWHHWRSLWRRITNLCLIGFSGNVFSSMSLASCVEDSQSREQWDSSTKGISPFMLALQQFHSREQSDNSHTSSNCSAVRDKCPQTHLQTLLCIWIHLVSFKQDTFFHTAVLGSILLNCMTLNMSICSIFCVYVTCKLDFIL